MKDGPTGFAWRPALSPDWEARRAALAASISGAPSPADQAAWSQELRWLAFQQTGPREEARLQALLRKVPKDLPNMRRFRLGLVGNRTLSFLAGALPVAGLARGLLIETVEAPYDSAASMAYGALHVFEGHGLDAVLAVFDAGNFARDAALLDAGGEAAALAAAEEFLRRLAGSVRDGIGAPLILATLPAPTMIASADLATPGSDGRFIARLNLLIADGAQRGDWLIWDMAGLAARVGAAAWFDPVAFHHAKAPFAVSLCPQAADHLCRVVAAMAGKSCRALVLDLDNTLWGGVIGDDGLNGIRLGQGTAEGEAYLAFQRFILDLHRRGVVLAVSSKNTDSVAREPFRSHPEMLIKENNIAVFQANWEDKATNIAAIAESLRLGLDSIAFADDNPAERERVRQSLPQVSVPELGDEPAYYAARLADAGLFEHLALNSDDLKRSASYAGDARRAELKASAGNYGDYLDSLKMVLSVAPFDEAGNARIAQLINKSNQFNVTTRRYNGEDVRRLASDPAYLCWQARLSDTFGDHGMIGVVIVKQEAAHWQIDSWLQSCRVLSRGVEEALANLLVEAAKTAGIGEIFADYIPTARNAMVADLFPRLGFAPAGDREDGGLRFVCHTTAFEPFVVHAVVITPSSIDSLASPRNSA